MRRRSEQGFTILEMLVVVIVGGILIGTVAGTYQKFMNIHRRQQRIILVERELGSIQFNFRQSLTTMPGREFGYYSGAEFTVPELPSIGSGEGAIELGPVTPLKINGNDAISIIYGSHKTARMELVEPSREVLGKGVAKVAVPGVENPSDLQFNTGDLMLLVGDGPGVEPSVGRLVKLNGPGRIIWSGKPKRNLVEFNYDFCESGECGVQIPLLVNRTAQKIFGTGGVLVPIKFVTFYLFEGGGRRLVIRNEGGRIEMNEEGKGYRITGGRESFLGEADSLRIIYVLKDNSEQPTPNSPMVEWLDQIKAVKMEVDKTVPLPTGGETASRTLSVSYPVTIRTLE